VKSSGSPSVLLIDKQKNWEKPIACEEGVLKILFRELIADPDPAWIRFEVEKATLHSPGGSLVTYHDKNKGYMLDRRRMQQDMAQRCATAGVDCRFDGKVVSVERTSLDGLGRRVALGDGRTTTCRVLIDCSGPLSSLGKGERIGWKCPDLEPAFFAHVQGVDVDTNAVQVYVGSKVAPGGYGWIFPRGNREASVGVLVGSAYRNTANIRDLLRNLLDRTCPGCTVTGTFAGAIPCTGKGHPMAVPGLLKAGDAASTVNPFSRAGIMEAMFSGAMAGEAAAKMLGVARTRDAERICRQYEKSWKRKKGAYHQRLARVKTSLARVPDADYDNAARALSEIPRDQLKMSRIFSVSLRRFPRMVWALRYGI
jgi:flavin-dependent dehydrogenase